MPEQGRFLRRDQRSFPGPIREPRLLFPIDQFDELVAAYLVSYPSEVHRFRSQQRRYFTLPLVLLGLLQLLVEFAELLVVLFL